MIKLVGEIKFKSWQRLFIEFW